MNLELAREVLLAAEESQKTRKHLPDKRLPKFDMSDWLSSSELYDEWGDSEVVPIEQLRENSCGTSACLAGFASILATPKGSTTDGASLWDSTGNYLGEISSFAQDELGLTRDQAEAVFYTTNEVALDRFRYLIENPETDGYELANMFPQLSRR